MKSLLEETLAHYPETEFPALLAQIREWENSRPLAGLRILECTPVFRNTMAKYAALQAAGAQVTVHTGERMPYDPAILAALPDFGIRVGGEEIREETFDCVSDCAGDHANVPARLGYIELTRTGGFYYEHAQQPVFWADNSQIKEIETGLGTGDGFERAIKRLTNESLENKNIVLFGCGKVGTGVAIHTLACGSSLTIVEKNPDPSRTPKDARLLHLNDKTAIEAAIQNAWCVVTATGVRHALVGHIDPSVLLNSRAKLVNVGVEDEYGDAIAAERVFNNKRPLNFLLEEPTRLRYIDPTMALQNIGILYLLKTKNPPSGLIKPSRKIEQPILQTVRDAGAITRELDLLDAVRNPPSERAPHA